MAVARWRALAWGPLVVLLAGCAAGAPEVASNVTPTAPVSTAAKVDPTPRATATATAPVPSATAAATQEPAAEASPTRTPKPTRTATPRPEPPADEGTGRSQVYERGTSARPEIALTFDAGSDRGSGELILDTLAEYGVKASFGITGRWAEENPDLVKRMVREGHMVFNHTWSHRSFTGFSTQAWDGGVLTIEERLREIEETERLIRELTKYDTAPYFRPPYGDLDDSVLADLGTAGYDVTVMWSCDTLGWNGASVEEILDRCAVNATAGDIILLHVGSDTLDAQALPRMIETLQEQGFDLVTVEELLQP